ncbi:MAG: hypothetical protein QXE99_06155 [Acidilobaceae archaeon]
MVEATSSEGRSGFNLARKVVYEDRDIVILETPDDRELEEIILFMLRERNGMSIKEIKSELAGVASEDRIRRVVYRLARSNRVLIDKMQRLYLLGD